MADDTEAIAPAESKVSLNTLTLRICLLGFLVNCKPSEPFLSLYLNETKSFSEDVLASSIYPWSLFGTFVFLLPFGLAAEVVGCRPVILVGLLCREATRALLIFGTSVGTMALMQVCYGAGAAANAIYFAYVYAIAPTRADFAVLTSAVLAAYHAGNVCGALLGELLVSVIQPQWRRDVTPLFYLSWLTCSLGTLAFVALPTPRRALPTSLAQHLVRDGAGATSRALLALWAPATSRLWLGWWLLAASGQVVVLNYFQLQLLTIDPDTPFGLLEAAIEAGLLLGALVSLPLAPYAGRRPTGTLVLSSVARAACLGGAALCARPAGQGGERSALLACVLNVLAAILFGVQDALGRVALAHATTPAARLPLLLSANTLLANGVAAATGAAAGASWTANDYYVGAAAMQAALALVALAVRPAAGARGVGTSAGARGGGAGGDAGGDDDRGVDADDIHATAAHPAADARPAPASSCRLGGGGTG